MLVAERYKDRVQEVRIIGTDDTSRCIRFFGQGVLLDGPEYLDCNKEVIIVSEYSCRISMFSWCTGDLLAQFGSFGRGPGQLIRPRGVRLVGNGARVAVCDTGNRRLCVFTLDGEFVEALRLAKQFPPHVAPSNALDLECFGSEGSFLVGTFTGVVKLSRSGKHEQVPMPALFVAAKTPDEPVMLAALADRELVFRCASNIMVYRSSLRLRVQWLALCVLVDRGI